MLSVGETNEVGLSISKWLHKPWTVVVKTGLMRCETWQFHNFKEKFSQFHTQRSQLHNKRRNFKEKRNLISHTSVVISRTCRNFTRNYIAFSNSNITNSKKMGAIPKKHNYCKFKEACRHFTSKHRNFEVNCFFCYRHVYFHHHSLERQQITISWIFNYFNSQISHKLCIV